MIDEECDQHLSRLHLQNPASTSSSSRLNSCRGKQPRVEEELMEREGGKKEEKKLSGRVQESKKKKWWRRLHSFFRAAKKQPPESSSGQGEKRKIPWAGRSSNGHTCSRSSISDELGEGGVGVVCDQHLSTPPKPSINTADQHPHPHDETSIDIGEGNSQERREMEKGGQVGEIEEELMEKEGGKKEERKESARVQESKKRKKWWRRLHSFFRAVRKQRKIAWAGRSSDDYIFSRYSISQELGRGGFGVVYKGRRLKDDRKVALKYVTKTENTIYLTIPDHPNPLPNEIALTILANKGHSVPEIIRLLDWQDHPDHFVMVLECPSPCESLEQFLKRHGGRLDEEKARHIMMQVVHAANVCCTRGVLHRDIKTDNLLINSKTSKVKLIDFGCGDMLKSSAYSLYIGTAPYSPPEFHDSGKYYGRQATAWSLGVLMFVMLCGRFPKDDDLLLLKWKHWTINDLSRECCCLLEALLQKQPSRRLALGLILSHDWFKFNKKIFYTHSQLREYRKKPSLKYSLYQSIYERRSKCAELCRISYGPSALGSAFVDRLVETIFQRWLLPVFAKLTVCIKYLLIKLYGH